MPVLPPLLTKQSYKMYIIKICHSLLGHTQWHVGERGSQFIWRRYTAAAGWEYREMTPEEQRESTAWWANQV